MKSYTLLINPAKKRKIKKTTSSRRTNTMKKKKKTTRKNPGALVLNPEKNLSSLRLKSILKDLRKKSSDGKNFYSTSKVATRHHLSFGLIERLIKKHKIKRAKASRIVRKRTAAKKTTAKKTTKKTAKKTTKKRKIKASNIAPPKKGTKVYIPVRKGKLVKRAKVTRKRVKVKSPYLVLVNPKPEDYAKKVGWTLLGFIGTKFVANVAGEQIIKATTRKDTAGVPLENKIAPFVKPAINVAIVGFLGFTKFGKNFIPRRGELALGAGLSTANSVLKDFVAPRIPNIDKDGKENPMLTFVKNAIGDSNEAVIVLPEEAFGDYVYANTKRSPTVTDYTAGDYVGAPDNYLADYVTEPAGDWQFPWEKPKPHPGPPPAYNPKGVGDIDVDDIGDDFNDEYGEVFDEPEIV